MMKSKYTDFEQLNSQINTSIRNGEIRAMWKGLSYSDLNYDSKIDKIKQEYHLSYESVTRIIYKK